MKLETHHLSYQYDGQLVLDDLTVKLPPKKFTGIIGPNGSGKTTFIKALSRSLEVPKGSVLLEETDIRQFTYKETAQRLAVVGQEPELPFDFQVAEIVMMGRYPAKRFFASETYEDAQIVEQALTQVGIAHLAKRSFQHLSGGEKQRVLIARALAQQTECLILDEPTNHLDIHYQLELFDLLQQLDLTVLAAIHDLNIASLYCHYLFVIQNGRLFLAGEPTEILTQELLAEVFQVSAEVRMHERLHRPVITYLPKGVIQ